MNLSWFVAPLEGVEASQEDDDGLSLVGWDNRITLRRPPEATRAAFERLTTGGATVREFTRLLLNGEPGETARFLKFLRRAAGRSMVGLSLHIDDGPLVTLTPTAPAFVVAPIHSHGDSWVLSRFAYLHRVGELLVFESPSAAARLLVEDDRFAELIPRLAKPTTAADLARHGDLLDNDSAEGLLALLAAAGVVTRVDEEGTSAEDSDESLRMWEFHDLLFHARSRLGRHDAPAGGTLLWAGYCEPTPALRQNYPGEPIPLPVPDAQQLKKDDPSFATVSDRRRSIREYGRQALTRQQLGEFLYRVGRVTERFKSELEHPDCLVTMEFTKRSYGGAGSLHELEIYPLVQRCEGLDPGLYHYDPLNHRLGCVPAPLESRQALVAEAAVSALIEAEEIQTLLILSARFPRMSWKYAGMAYAAILKDVGVLYHSMYLSATAMDLAPCALGLGDSDVFAKAIGSDYYAETSVGEFLLGSREVEPGGADAPS